MNLNSDLFDDMEEDEIEEYGISELDSYDDDGEFEDEEYNEEEEFLMNEDARIDYDMDDEFEN